jgi:hypothetical protein
VPAFSGLIELFEALTAYVAMCEQPRGDPLVLDLGADEAVALAAANLGHTNVPI